MSDILNDQMLLAILKSVKSLLNAENHINVHMHYWLKYIISTAMINNLPIYKDSRIHFLYLW